MPITMNRSLNTLILIGVVASVLAGCTTIELVSQYDEEKWLRNFEQRYK